MNENSLVLIKPVGSHMEPYTTADAIAEYAEVHAQTVEHLIRKHKNDLEEFGTLGFEIRACPHRTGSSARKIYHLNEQQATLLITYLKNTAPVRKFKKALVRSFFEARQELARREVQQAIKTPIRRKLTDAIRDSGEDERMKGHAYTAYTNLIYKAATGMNASQIRKAAGAGRLVDAVPLISSETLAEIAKREAQVATLLDCGMKYDDIKAVLMQKAG